MTETFPLATIGWGQGPPRLVLIHGFADGAFVWDGALSRLSAEHGGISVDLRGHGDSPWDPLQRYATHVLAADVVRAVDSPRMLDLTVIGHSLGAEIAIHVAYTLGPRVRRLVLIDGGPEVDARAASAIREALSSQRHGYRSVAEFANVLAQRHPLASDEAILHYARSALRPAARGGLELKLDPGFIRGACPAQKSELWECLRATSCEKLVLRGELSAVLSQRSLIEVAERLSSCRVASVPRAGHAVPFENPMGLCDVVLPLLAEPA